MSASQIGPYKSPLHQATASLEPYLKSPETYKRILLVGSVVLSAISLVPGLRIPAALALRTISCISSAAMAFDSVTKPDSKSRYMRITLDVIKLGVVVLGLAGLAAGSPALIIVSLVIETAMQAFSCLKAFFYDKNESHISRGLIHLGLFVIGALTLSAVATGGWPLIVAAAAVNTIMMVFISYKIMSEIAYNKETDGSKIAGKIFDGICYLALFGISYAGAFSSAELNGRRITGRTYHVKNETNENMYIAQGDGKPRITLAPGQEITFDSNYSRLPFYYNSTSGHDFDGTLTPETTHDVPTRQEPIPPNQMGTAPLGGAVLATRKTAYDSRAKGQIAHSPTPERRDSASSTGSDPKSSLLVSNL